MKLHDFLFAADSMPDAEALDLLIAVAALSVAEKRMLKAFVDKMIADIELEEALEKHAAADAAVKKKQAKYGVGQ